MYKFQLKEAKKDIKIGKVLNASYKFNKKINKETSKAIKKTIKKKEMEDIMKSNTLTMIITILTVVLAGIGFVFKTGAQYQKIVDSGAKTSEQLTKLIKLNESSIKDVAQIKDTSNQLEIYLNLTHQKVFGREIKIRR